MRNVNARATNFSGSHFEFANFRNAKLISAILKNTDFSCIFHFWNSHFMTWTKYGLERIVRDKGADLTNADLTCADLENASFIRAILKETNFSKTILENAVFISADLTSAILKKAKLKKADFSYMRQFINCRFHFDPMKYEKLNYLSGANLTNADFADADCEDANFIKANLTGTKFKNANLKGARIERKWKDYLATQNVRGFNEIRWE